MIIIVVGSGGFVGQLDDIFVYAGILSLGELNAIHFAADEGRPFTTLLPPSAGPAGYALKLQEGTYFDAGFLPECVLEDGHMSISVWLKPDTIGMDGVHRYPDDDVLLFELDYVSEASWGRREVNLRNGNVFVVVDSRSHDEIVVINQYPCSFPMVASEWSSLCIQWDVSSATVNITLAGQRCVNGEASPPFPLGNGAKSLTLTVGRGYTGLLDEMQVWCSNSSTDTTASCFNHPNDILSGRELGLSAYWSFDEGRGRICQDMANKGEMGKGLGIVSFNENYYFLNSDPSAPTRYIADLHHWSTSSAPISHVVNALDNAPVKLSITGKDVSFRHLTARLVSGPSHGSLYHIPEYDADVWFPASERTPLVVGSHFPLDEGRAGGAYYVWEEGYTTADSLLFPVLDYVVYTIVAEDGSSSSYESPRSITLSIKVHRSLPRELPITVTWGSGIEVTPTISLSDFEIRDVDAWEGPQLLHAAVSLSSDDANNKSQVSLVSQQGLNFGYAGKEPDMNGFGSDLRFTGTLESISTALKEVTVALPNGTRGQGELGLAVSDDEDVNSTWLTVPMQEIVEFNYRFGSTPIIAQLRPWSAPLEGGSMVTLKVSNADWGNVEDIGYSCIFGGDTYTTAFEFTLGEIKCPIPFSPSGIPGPVSLKLCTGTGWMSNTVNFWYFAQPTLLGVTPLLLPLSGGGAALNLLGSGFDAAFSDMALCRFEFDAGLGGKTMYEFSTATVLSETKSSCFSPPLPVSSSTVGAASAEWMALVTFSVNGFHWPNTSHEGALLSVMYGQLPEIGWITVRDVGQNETNGQEGWFVVKPEPVLVVHGNNFRNTTELACSFGGTTTKAMYVSEWQVECDLPHSNSASSEEVVLVAVTVNGVDFSSQVTLYDLGALSLRKARRKYISAVNPSRGPITGGSHLVALGKGVGSAKACEFVGTTSTVTVPALMVDVDILNCITPPMEKAGEFTLSLPDISGYVSFFFYNPVNVMAVTPQFIPVDLLSSEDRLLKPGLGQIHQITVFGSGFLAEGNRTFLYCWFEFDEEDDIEAAMDGSSPNVLVTLAEIWDDSSASCFLPPEFTNLNHSFEKPVDDEVVQVPAVRHVRVRLTQNLIDASSDWADLFIYEIPTLSSIAPGVGTVGGGQIEVAVRVASSLPPLPLSSPSGEGESLWCCRVGNTLVSATLDESDSSVVHCTIPESFEEGSVLVTLEVGEAEGLPLTPLNRAAAFTTSTSAMLFTYLMEPQVVASSPQNGPLMGGTPLIVSGAGMQSIPGLSTACTFTFIAGEVVVVNASYVSPTSVHCISPVHPSVAKPNLSDEEMTAAVAISLNGGLQWSKSKANYLYTVPATVTRVSVTLSPSVSDDNDANPERKFQAIAYGSGFINSTELICLLDGSYYLPCHYLSEGVVACELPIGDETEAAILGFLQVSNNNGISKSEGDEFWIPPGRYGEEVSISPSSGPLRGGTVINVYATGGLSSSSSPWLNHYIDMLLQPGKSAVVLCGFENSEMPQMSTITTTIAYLNEEDRSVLSCTTPSVLYSDSVSVTLGGYEVGIFTYSPDIQIF